MSLVIIAERLGCPVAGCKMNTEGDADSGSAGLNSVLASFVIIGILLTWTGLRGIIGSPTDVPSAFMASKAVLSVLLVPLSFICLMKGRPIACAVSLTVALLVLIRISASFIPEYGGSSPCLPFSVAIAFCAVVAFLKQRRWLAISATLLAASVAMESSESMKLIAYTGETLSGAVFISMGLRGFSSDTASRDNGEPSSVDAVVPGFMVAGIQGLCTILGSDTAVLAYVPILSIVMLAISFCALRRGRILSGTFLMMYSIYGLVGMVPALSGTEVLESASGVYCIPAAFCGFLLLKNNRLLGIPAASFGLLGIASAASGYGWLESAAYAVAGVGFCISSALLMSGRMMLDDSAKVLPEMVPGSQVPSAGGFALSCMMLLSFLLGLQTSGNPDDSPADAVLLLSASLCMVMSAAAAGSRMITESAILLISGVSVLIFTVAEMTYSTDGLVLVAAFMAFGLAAGSFVFFRRRELFRGTATAAMAAALITIPFGIDAACILSLVSGLLFMASAMKKTLVFGILGNAKIVHRQNLVQSDSEYSAILTRTMGTMLIAFLTLMYGLNTIGSDQYQGLEVTRIAIGSILMGFGIYAVSKGIGPAGIFMFMTSAFGMTSSTMGMAGIPVPGAFQQLVALAFVPVFVSTFRSGDRILFLISFLMFMAFVLNPITGAGDAFAVADMALKAATCASALILWIGYDTGRAFMEGVQERLTRSGRVRKTVPRDPLRTVPSAAGITAALSCIWAGFSMATGSAGDSSLMVPGAVLSFAATSFSLCMIAKGMTSGGFAILATGVTCVSVQLGPDCIDLPSMAALACAGILALLRGMRFIAVASVFLLVARSATVAGFHMLGAAMMIAAGMALLSNSSAGLCGWGRPLRIDGRAGDAALLMAASVATSSVVSLMCPGAMLSGLVLSVAASCIAIATMMRGDASESLYVLTMAVPAIGYGILGLAGMIGESSPVLVMSATAFVCGLSFAVRRDMLLAASCMAVTAMFLTYAATGDPAACGIGGAFFCASTVLHIVLENRDAVARAA